MLLTDAIGNMTRLTFSRTSAAVLPWLIACRMSDSTHKTAVSVENQTEDAEDAKYSLSQRATRRSRNFNIRFDEFEKILFEIN